MADTTDNRIDREINLKGVVWTVVGLAILCVVSFVLMWGLYSWRLSVEAKADPTPSPLPQASETTLPPEPRLQDSPAGEMELMRAEEDRILESYGMTDEEAGLARIPLDRAMEKVAEEKLAPRAATLGLDSEEGDDASLATPEGEPAAIDGGADTGDAGVEASAGIETSEDTASDAATSDTAAGDDSTTDAPPINQETE